MPIYKYFCRGCSLEFEEIRNYDKRDVSIVCPDCKGKDTARVLAVPFGISVKADSNATLYSKKEIDKAVGEDAEKKWEGYNKDWKGSYEERRKKRWDKYGKLPENLDIPKDPDGKYSPLMHLGTKEDRKVKKEYSEALKEHRIERKKKGIKQFEGGIDQDSVIKIKPKKEN